MNLNEVNKEDNECLITKDYQECFFNVCRLKNLVKCVLFLQPLPDTFTLGTTEWVD